MAPAPPAGARQLTEEELALRAGPVVCQGWIHSREPTLRALWHRRWAVARQGRLDLYENETMAKIVSTVPLQQCRVEKLVVRDSRLQDGCDFEHGIRVVLGKGLGFGKEKLLATTSEGEQNAWGAGLMVCRHGVLEVAAPAATLPAAAAPSQAAAAQAAGSAAAAPPEAPGAGGGLSGLGSRLASFGLDMGRRVESVLLVEPDQIRNLTEVAPPTHAASTERVDGPVRVRVCVSMCLCVCMYVCVCARAWDAPVGGEDVLPRPPPGGVCMRRRRVHATGRCGRRWAALVAS